MKAKRFLAFALALIMALGCMGISVFAEESKTYVGDQYTVSIQGTLINDTNKSGKAGQIQKIHAADESKYIEIVGTPIQDGDFVKVTVKAVKECAMEIDSTIIYLYWEVTGEDESVGTWSENSADGRIILPAQNPEITFTAATTAPEMFEGTVGTYTLGTVAAENFSGTVAYTANVYTTADGTTAATGISAAVDGTALKATTTADVKQGTYYVSVSGAYDTESDTLDARVPVTVYGAFLDLDGSDTPYPDKKTVEQKYKLTQTGDTTYIEKTKVKVEWVLPEISASFTQSKTWNPDTMQWDYSKVTSNIEDKTANFTFTNYSSEKVKVQVNFTKSIGDKATLTGEVKVLDTAVGTDKERTVSDNAPFVAYPVKLTFKNAEFNSLSAGEGTYGTYTAKLIALSKYNLTVSGSNLTADTTNPAQITEYSTVTVKANAAEGYAFTGAVTTDGVTPVSGGRRNGNTTLEVTVKDPTKAADVKPEVVAATKVYFGVEEGAGTVTFGGDLVQEVDGKIYIYIPQGYFAYKSHDGNLTSTLTFKDGNGNIYETVTAVSTNESCRFDNITDVEEITGETMTITIGLSAD